MQMRKDYNENAGAWWSSSSSATTATSLAKPAGFEPLGDAFHSLSRDGTDFESTDDHYDYDNDVTTPTTMLTWMMVITDG